MYQEFLRELFRGSTGGYVSIVTSEGPRFPIDQLWFDAAHTQGAEGLSLGLPLTTEKHVYFVPHTYITRDNRTKENASSTGTCIWLESDDEYFNWNAIEEAPPSAVVRTSPGRHHCFWFLDESTELYLIEATNKALTYKYLKKDRSGWDISQLMRVPGFQNRKRSVLNDVELVEFHPERRYNLVDTFGHLPQPAENKIVYGSRDADIDLPPQEQWPSYETIYQDNRANFKPNFFDALRNRAPDRSRKLWYIHNECLRMNFSRTETFVIARNSQNNKFADAYYNGDKELWADVCAAYRIHENGEDNYLSDKIAGIRLSANVPREEKFRQISVEIWDYLSERGRFYYCPDTQKAFYEVDKRLIPVNKRSSEYSAYLDSMFGVNSSTEEFRFVAHHMTDRITEQGNRITIHNASFFNEVDNILYLSDNDGGIFRLDGDVITRLDPGVDSVVFSHNPKSDPIRINQKVLDYSPLDKYVLSWPNYKQDGLTKEDAMLLSRTWMYSTFLMQRSKGMLVMKGTRGSGKTTLFKCMEWLLVGPKSDVRIMPDNEKELKENLREQHHVFFDGVDPGVLANGSRRMPNWVQNTLSTTATGTEQSVRILYTDDEHAVYKMNTAIGITTMDASWLRADVVDRSIVLDVERFEEFQSIDEIQQQVIDHRDEIWWEVLTELNKIIKSLKTWPAAQMSQMRMANFGKFLSIVCAIRGHDFTRIERFLLRKQDMIVLGDDAVWECLKVWLENDANLGRSINARNLHSDLIRTSLIMGVDYEKTVRSSKSLAMRLRDIAPNIRDFTMTEIQAPSRTGKIYKFEQKVFVKDDENDEVNPDNTG